VTASYSGDGNFSPSSSSAQQLTISQSSSVTQLTLSSPSATYGNETAESFGVNVLSVAAGTPTRMARVDDNGSTLCNFNVLPSDSGCEMPTATELPAGTYQMTASYLGDSNFSASATTSGQQLTISSATTTTALTLSSFTVSYGNEQAVQFGASVTPEYSGVPTGLVTIAEAGQSLCSFEVLFPACTASATALPPGTYQVTASYSGTVTSARRRPPRKS
jgi:hypothetical protein